LALKVCGLSFLGNVKFVCLLQVTDRQSWRAALEHGRYEFLNDENKENGIIKTVNEESEEMETDDQDKFIVKDR